MFRSISLPVAVLALCSISLVQSQTTACQDALQDYTICLLSAPETTTDDSIVDEAACYDCFAGTSAFDATVCDDVKDEICSYFKTCLQKCFPQNAVCQEELASYYACEFGQTYAPENCAVTCDGMSIGGDGGNNGSDDNALSSGDGGDNDAVDQKSSTSAGSSTTSMVTLSVSATTLIALATIVL